MSESETPSRVKSRYPMSDRSRIDLESAESSREDSGKFRMRPMTSTGCSVGIEGKLSLCLE